MRRLKWISSKTAIAAFALAIIIGRPVAANAQACCVGATAVGSGRLVPYENAMLGVTVRGSWIHGSMSRDGAYTSTPSDAYDVTLDQQLIGTLRLLRHAQLTIVLPFVQTFRKIGTLSESGGGIGDVQLGARYDFVEPGALAQWPGIALLAGLTIPTGVAPESASGPLAAGSTGTGTVIASGRIALERAFKTTFVLLSAGAEWRSPRVVSGFHTQRAPAFSAGISVGHAFKNDLVVALSASYRAELPARLDGRSVEGGGQELTTIAISAGRAISDDFRFQASISADVPAAPLSRNEPAALIASFSFMRSSW
ncbi:MAG: transporter [Polyangiaceae bacterium]|nr:transporter [Polyangiaceae bacterium]